MALSDNSNSNYKARELKSVHVDAVGVFVKFVIHKNHINKHNLYNQVSGAVFKMSRTKSQKLEMPQVYAHFSLCCVSQLYIAWMGGWVYLHLHLHLGVLTFALGQDYVCDLLDYFWTDKTDLA